MFEADCLTFNSHLPTHPYDPPSTVIAGVFTKDGAKISNLTTVREDE